MDKYSRMDKILKYSRMICIVNFEQISQIVLMIPLLKLNKKMLAVVLYTRNTRPKLKVYTFT